MSKTKENSDYDFENFKKDSLVRPRDLAWQNWAKFVKVGDKVQGYLRDAFYRPAQGQFDEQRGLTIEQVDGTMVNVGIKRLPFILPATDSLHIGDPITIELAELKPSETKGFSPTKIFAYYSPKTVTEGKTVKELEAEDMSLGGTKDPVEEGDVMPEANDVPFKG